MKNIKIGIVGLGYVGLPLAVEFGKKYFVVGFDINEKRVSDLKNNNDNTLEVSSGQLKKVVLENVNSKYNEGLFLTNNSNDIKDCNFYSYSSYPCG